MFYFTLGVFACLCENDTGSKKPLVSTTFHCCVCSPDCLPRCATGLLLGPLLFSICTTSLVWVLSCWWHKAAVWSYISVCLFDVSARYYSQHSNPVSTDSGQTFLFWILNPTPPAGCHLLQHPLHGPKCCSKKETWCHRVHHSSWSSSTKQCARWSLNHLYGAYISVSHLFLLS